MNKCHVVAIFTIELIIAATLMNVCLAIEPVEVNSAIDQAEIALTSASVAVDRAYSAGADISELLNKLSIAGDLLSEADMALRAGNYETANLLAIKSENALDGIASNANQLKADAEKTKTNTLLLTVAGSSVGLVLLVVLGIIGWWFLRKRYTSEPQN
jgi:hypothetical protein